MTYFTDDLEDDEVAEFLGTILDQELDTIVDDNSLQDIGSQLCTHFRLCDKGDTVQLGELCNQLDIAAGISATVAHQATTANLENHEDDNNCDNQDEVHFIIIITFHSIIQERSFGWAGVVISAF